MPVAIVGRGDNSAYIIQGDFSSKKEAEQENRRERFDQTTNRIEYVQYNTQAELQQRLQEIGPARVTPDRGRVISTNISERQRVQEAQAKAANKITTTVEGDNIVFRSGAGGFYKIPRGSSPQEIERARQQYQTILERGSRKIPSNLERVNVIREGKVQNVSVRKIRANDIIETEPEYQQALSGQRNITVDLSGLRREDFGSSLDSTFSTISPIRAAEVEQQNLKRQASLLGENGQKTNNFDLDNRSSFISSDSLIQLDDSRYKSLQARRTKLLLDDNDNRFTSVQSGEDKGYGEGFLRIPKTLIESSGKITSDISKKPIVRLFSNPFTQKRLSDNPNLKFFEQRQTTKQAATNLAIVGGLAIGGPYFPAASTGIGLGFVTSKAIETSAKPTKENIGELGFMVASAAVPFVVSKFKASSQVKSTPINLKFAEAAEIKAVKTKGQTVLRLNPLDFAAKIGETEITGTGVGKGIITEKGKVGAVFGIETKGPKPTKTIVGVKGLTKTTGDVTKSLTISRAETRIKNKPIVKRGIAFSKSKEVVGGEFPRQAFKTLGFEPKLKQGQLQPTTGAAGILRKDFEITAPNFAGKPTTVETFTLFEKGTSAKNIAKATEIPQSRRLPAPRPTNLIETTVKPKQSETFSGDSAFKFKQKQISTGQKESLIAGEFIKSIKETARQEALRIAPKPKTQFKGGIVLPGIKTRPFVASRKSQKVLPKPIIDTKPKADTLFKIPVAEDVLPKIRIIPRNKTTPIEEIKPTTRIPTAFEPITQTKPTFKSPAPSPFPPILSSPPLKPAESKLFFPKIESFTPKKKKQSKGKGAGRGFEYTPSFTAIALGIRGKKPKDTSGLAIRPLIR